MSDSLKTRVGRIVAGTVHALIDHIEDQAPEAVMEQAIRDADGVIDDVRHELGVGSANRHIAQQQHATLNREHEKLVEQIEQALTRGREELARAAIARQLDIEAQLPVLETTLAEHARQESELQSYVSALLAKKREMEAALATFRKSRAAAASSIPPSGGPANSKNEHRMGAAADAFDRVYNRQTGLSGTARTTTIEQAAKLQELDELVRQNKISERIAQLKAGKP